MPALDPNDLQHVVIQVGSGGYIVTAWTRSLEDAEAWQWSTSIFTDSAVMSAHVKRVVEDIEGPGEPVDIEKLTKRRKN